MAANTNPIFPESGAIGIAHLTAANTNRDGSGTIVDLTAVAGADGLRVNKIEVRAEGTTTPGMIRIFIHNGTTWRLWKEIPVSAVTPSATVEAWNDFVFPDFPFVLPSGWKIGAATEKTETFNAFAFGGNY